MVRLRYCRSTVLFIRIKKRSSVMYFCHCALLLVVGVYPKIIARNEKSPFISKKVGFKVAGPGEGLTLKDRKRESPSSLSSLSTRMTRSSISSLVPNQASGKNKNCTTLTLGNLESGLFSKRLVLNETCTHLPLPPRSKYSEC